VRESLYIPCCWQCWVVRNSTDQKWPGVDVGSQCALCRQCFMRSSISSLLSFSPSNHCTVASTLTCHWLCVHVMQTVWNVSWMLCAGPKGVSRVELQGQFQHLKYGASSSSGMHNCNESQTNYSGLLYLSVTPRFYTKVLHQTLNPTAKLWCKTLSRIMFGVKPRF